MRLRKLLLATGAIVAAGVMAIAPSAMATSTGVSVGSNTTGNHAINLVFKSASVTIKVYGITTNITCTGGSASGFAHAGASGTVPAYATIDTLSLTCPSIFPGTTVTMSATCNIDISASSGYTTGTTDSVVGAAAFNNCASVSISNGCTFTIGGSSTATYAETALSKPVGTVQDLSLGGSTITINNVSGCLGAVTNGQSFTLNALFNVVSANGLINIFA